MKHEDNVLKERLNSKAKRGTYISTRSQNILIENTFTVRKGIMVTMIEDAKLFLSS